LAQQKLAKTTGTTRVQEGVVGKSFPFQTIDKIEMTPAMRDAPTSYLNAMQSKRRAVLADFNAFVLIDSMDKVHELADPQSAYAEALVRARNRRQDRSLLAPFGSLVGGAIGAATVVDEAGESTSSSQLPAAQIIVNGAANLTMTKVRQAKLLMDLNDVDDEDRYFWYSPTSMQNGLLKDTQVTSSDYNTIKALAQGGFPMDQSWMGFKWRWSNLLPIVSGTTVRGCIAYQKQAVGLAFAMLTGVEIDKAVHMQNAVQCGVMLSLGAVRIDDRAVVEIDVDESV
jgi:hypothetical protein